MILITLIKVKTDKADIVRKTKQGDSEICRVHQSIILR